MVWMILCVLIPPSGSLWLLLQKRIQQLVLWRQSVTKIQNWLTTLFWNNALFMAKTCAYDLQRPIILLYFWTPDFYQNIYSLDSQEFLVGSYWSTLGDLLDLGSPNSSLRLLGDLENKKSLLNSSFKSLGPDISDFVSSLYSHGLEFSQTCWHWKQKEKPKVWNPLIWNLRLFGRWYETRVQGWAKWFKYRMRYSFLRSGFESRRHHLYFFIIFCHSIPKRNKTIN